MKSAVLFILMLILLVDVAEDGYLGNVKYCLPQPSAKTTVISSHHFSGLGQGDFQNDLASPYFPGSPRYGEARPVSIFVPPNLQIMHCCHLSSSGGIPL